MSRSILKLLLSKGLALALMVTGPITTSAVEKPQAPKPSSARNGYAVAAEDLRVYYEVFGEGEPIVVMAGGFGDITSMAQLDRMGDLMRKDYDWRPEIAKLKMPTLLLFADHDAVSTRHIAEFFALFDGGLRDPGWRGTPHYARARLAIVPGYTHYNFGMGPDVARVIEAYLVQPTSKATQFTP